MNVLKDSPDVRRRYQALLDAAAHASVYHTLDWLLVFESLGYDLLFVEADAQTLVPFVCKGRGVLRRAFSLPYDTYGGAVAPADTTISYDEVLRALDIPSARIVDFGATTGSSRCKVEEVTTHIVELDADYDRVARSYASMNRRAIRQAARRGLEIRVLERADEIPLFYRFYFNSAVKYQSPPLPQKFFESIHAIMVPKELARFYLAWYGESPVAGNLVLRYRDKAYDWTWGYDAEHQHLRPTNALIDRAIRDEIARGAAQLNLGASPVTSNGNAQFKENFGARAYSYKVLSKVGFCYQTARAIKYGGARLAVRRNNPAKR